MPGLVELRSMSQFGMSAVVATFADGTDIYFARQLINERLANVEMPAGIERPKMGPVATGLGEVFQYTLSSSELNLTELRTMPRLGGEAQDAICARRRRNQFLGRPGETISNSHRSAATDAT